ncbi:interferon alpha-inducible protein 27-like protein 2B [Saccostrea echinata]|uniref:interferon alpha-inducible protein 27-like protein 2B n=1 Tax=Saccostrea echinata TaxID=191078 RepID=UPI002A7FE9ED|nr:interferon alpha-inducible protein 27-like protein 2B [Saccostrea echinata]
MVLTLPGFCPENPKNGFWYEEKEKGRCILRCEKGYEPSNCHVLRLVKGKWNHEIPHCKNATWISAKSILTAEVGSAAAVVGVPAALTAAGFTSAGVAAGSLAAWLQTPFTAAGSWFAASQSAGVLGAAASTKLGVGTLTGLATRFLSSKFSNCEKE